MKHINIWCSILIYKFQTIEPLKKDLEKTQKLFMAFFLDAAIFVWLLGIDREVINIHIK